AAIDLCWLALFVTAAAAMVSCINDAFDREDDRKAGKPNRFDDATAEAFARFLALPVIGVVFVLWHWRNQAELLVAAAILAAVFLAFSVPPLRLKNRGVGGAIADATGANVLPALMAALVVIADSGNADHWTWLAAVAVWSLSFGLRGIVWHQITDEAADAASG